MYNLPNLTVTDVHVLLGALESALPMYDYELLVQAAETLKKVRQLHDQVEH